jgi:EAL domain-containing protein (putative c-di-GMP-specific phosphodiesterase class I)
LSLTATAEGVEQAERLRMLEQVECDEAQGYHLERPIPPEALCKAIGAAPISRTDR